MNSGTQNGSNWVVFTHHGIKVRYWYTDPLYHDMHQILLVHQVLVLRWSLTSLRRSSSPRCGAKSYLWSYYFCHGKMSHHKIYILNIELLSVMSRYVQTVLYCIMFSPMKSGKVSFYSAFFLLLSSDIKTSSISVQVGDFIPKGLWSPRRGICSDALCVLWVGKRCGSMGWWELCEP